MSEQPGTKAIDWPNVITVFSVAILIGAEVFGGAYAGGWAFGILLGLSDTATQILQFVLLALGFVVMVIFVRFAERIEPFRKFIRRG